VVLTMQTEEEQRIFDLGVARGVEVYKTNILKMLYNQLDLEGDPSSECAACKITKQYIDIIENKTSDEE